MRRIAARYPDVTFLAGPGLARETTLGDPQSNVFRFAPDGAQTVGGARHIRLPGPRLALGRGGRRGLGRRVEPAAASWRSSARWAAASSSGTGPRCWHRTPPPPPHAMPRRRRRRPARRLLHPGRVPAGVGGRAAAARRHLVLGGEASTTPRCCRGRRGSHGRGRRQLDPAAWRPPRVARFEAGYARPIRSSPRRASSPRTVRLRLDVGVVTALEAADGDLGETRRRSRGLPAASRCETPTGPVRLDANRQAIVRGYLDRIVLSPGRPGRQRLRSVEGVDQTYGGAITPPRAAEPRTSPSAARARRRPGPADSPPGAERPGEPRLAAARRQAAGAQAAPDEQGGVVLRDGERRPYVADALAAPAVGEADDHDGGVARASRARAARARRAGAPA